MTSTRGRPHCQSLGLCRSLDHCCDLDLTCRSVWGLGGPEFPIGHLGNDYPPAAISYAGNTGGAPGKSANDKTACTDYAAVTAVAATGVQVRPSSSFTPTEGLSNCDRWSIATVLFVSHVWYASWWFMPCIVHEMYCVTDQRQPQHASAASAFEHRGTLAAGYGREGVCRLRHCLSVQHAGRQVPSVGSVLVSVVRWRSSVLGGLC